MTAQLLLIFFLVFSWHSRLQKQLTTRSFDTLLRNCGIWFLIRQNSFQSWFWGANSFSIDLLRHVKIVMPVLKNCLVSYERFLKTVYFVFWVEYRRETRWRFEAARDETYFRPVALSGVRVILYKQKVKSWWIKKFSKGKWNSKLTRGEFVALVILRLLLVKKIGVNQDRACALSWHWPFTFVKSIGLPGIKWFENLDRQSV